MDRVSVGIGMSAPFGLETEWDRGWVGRYHARLSRLQTININPSIAVKVTDWMSVGAGANAEWANATLSNNLDMGSLCQIFGAQQTPRSRRRCAPTLLGPAAREDRRLRPARGRRLGGRIQHRASCSRRARARASASPIGPASSTRLTGDAGFTVPKKAEVLRTAVGRAGEHRRDVVGHAAGPRVHQPLPGAAARPGLPGRCDVDELAALPGAGVQLPEP